MKKMLSGVFVAGLVFASSALAQGGPGNGPGPGPGGMRMYDPATVTTVSGTVDKVEKIPRRNHNGVHLTLSTSSGPLEVHLGPDFYVEKQDVKIAQGDQVEVTGSKVSFQGSPALIAQTVKKGDAVLTLRDAAGVPVWRGQGKP